ncbi:putative mannose-1-phosphate guanylyltransferase/mannose-6-phosphate isomerase [uncultured Desulfobacterium sp.]|uniref:Putative mannose-1-phosphate guanylyltransferase/mannose-6-phosphate isomerase n=1 Tax=uncultured Desulfobacterium sp. TaxID=201089 RepID=A0A445N0G7_9BACT|nr:putative mannose-1-phosphate guanylyltransferase/mannose-6-phosphate isomerase [uncultured Desulfobacterium sp.]
MFTVIMTGGSGTRFWPVSRQRRPKQFLNITGTGPMVVETCNRLKPVSRDEEMILVLGEQHLEEAKGLFSGRKVHMLAEPIGRNTAPCIGLGALYARHMGCKGSVAFLPADHYIGNPEAFLKALSAAGRLAEQGGIVTLGIVPSRPETGYGYIRRTDTCSDAGGVTAYDVSGFYEKPDLNTALGYLGTGEFYWNAGIFVATADTIIEEINKLLPDLYQGLLRLEKAMGTDRFDTEFKAVYQGLKGISFDYGIMEKTKQMMSVIPCECGWSDVGSWASVYELRSAEFDANKNLTEGQAIMIDCEGSLVSGNGSRLVACLGLKDCLIVDTHDALLVTHLDRSQDIRRIVDLLKQNKRDELL